MRHITAAEPIKPQPVNFLSNVNTPLFYQFLGILALKFKIDNGKLADVVVVTFTNLKQKLLSDMKKRFSSFARHISVLWVLWQKQGKWLNLFYETDRFHSCPFILT